MAEIPEGAKKPADRKKKDAPLADAFTFTDDDGNEYTLAETAAKITPGFIRKHRSSEPQEVLFDALELLADEDALEVIDNLSWKRNAEVLGELDSYIEQFFKVSLGE